MKTVSSLLFFFLVSFAVLAQEDTEDYIPQSPFQKKAMQFYAELLFAKNSYNWDAERAGEALSPIAASELGLAGELAWHLGKKKRHHLLFNAGYRARAMRLLTEPYAQERTSFYFHKLSFRLGYGYRFELPTDKKRSALCFKAGLSFDPLLSAYQGSLRRARELGYEDFVQGRSTTTIQREEIYVDGSLAGYYWQNQAVKLFNKPYNYSFFTGYFLNISFEQLFGTTLLRFALEYQDTGRHVESHYGKLELNGENRFSYYKYEGALRSFTLKLGIGF